MSRDQLPLALKPPRRPRFDNFVIGDNRAVVATLASGLEAGSWTFLGGPDGSGRTHLLSALFAERCRRGARALFIALREVNQRPLLDQALADLIVLDDVDALAGDPDAERGLFNALNCWLAERTTLVMSGASRERFALPDLRSRLAQATRLSLKPLDEPDLARLVVQLAAEHEVALGRGVVDYLLSRAPRNAGQIAELIELCAGRALTERRTLSIQLVREALDCKQLSASRTR